MDFAWAPTARPAHPRSIVHVPLATPGVRTVQEFAKTRDGIRHFLTYADNAAVGYFLKQGFTKEPKLDRDIVSTPCWLHYLHDPYAPCTGYPPSAGQVHALWDRPRRHRCWRQNGAEAQTSWTLNSKPILCPKCTAGARSSNRAWYADKPRLRPSVHTSSDPASRHAMTCFEVGIYIHMGVGI